jgi:hypothetical protein
MENEKRSDNFRIWFEKVTAFYNEVHSEEEKTIFFYNMRESLSQKEYDDICLIIKEGEGDTV